MQNNKIRQRSIENVHQAIGELHRRRERAHDQVVGELHGLRKRYSEKKAENDQANSVRLSLFVECLSADEKVEGQG